MNLFLKNKEKNIDKKKLSDYYYKLSLACHSGGMNMEAIEFIEKFQKLNKQDYPQKEILLIFGLIWRIINFFLALYFPKYYFKKIPTELDDAMIRLIIAKCHSMVTITPKKVFIEVLFYSNKLVKLDLSKTQLGTGMLFEYSAIFIWAGISKTLGSKVIDITENSISKDRPQEWMKLRYIKSVAKLFSGEFIHDTDENEVFEQGLKCGAFWETSSYLIFNCYIHIESGNWKRADEIRKKLMETADVFENDHARVQYYRISGIAMMKFRRLEEAMINSDEGMDMIAKTGHEAILMLVQCSRIMALTLNNHLDEAKEYLVKAEKVAEEKKKGVIFYSTFLVTKAYYLIAQIMEANTKDQQDQIKIDLLKTTSKAIKYSKKYEGNLTEAFRLRGMAFILSGKFRKALSCFKNAIDSGIKSGGKLELSRTYFELGKFLSNPKVKYNELNGNSASHYLKKAKSMFKVMDLQWDLGEYRKFTEKILEN